MKINGLQTGQSRKESFSLSPDRSTTRDGHGLPDSYRPRQYAALWQVPADGWRDRLAAALDRGTGNNGPSLFFRADDVGAGGRAFEALCRVFRHYEVPLAMAVVPAWLSEVRREQLFQTAPLEEPIWGWHQHGWRHINWQREGKKSEFGEQRPFEKQWRDLYQGRQKMEEIFGDHFVPVFSPPWNRLSHATLRILQELDFQAVSVAGPLPRTVRSGVTLPNYRVQLDLHTRKGKNAEADYDVLVEELGALLTKREPVGIMIHHQRMTRFAFEFLDELLNLLRFHLRAKFLSFREIPGKRDER